MADKRIDLSTVLEDLQAIVAEKGDGYCYRPTSKGYCAYTDETADGQLMPSCIVGHVLARHDLLLRPYSIGNAALTVGIHAADILEDFTPEAVDALAAAQLVQDTLVETWGDALIAAKNAAAESVSA